MNKRNVSKFVLLVSSILSGSACALENSPAQLSRDKIMDGINISIYGYCSRNNKNIPVEDFLELKRESVWLDEKKNIRYVISGEMLFIERYDDEGRLKNKDFIDFGSLVSTLYDEVDMDIDLNLVLLKEREFGIIWRETYQHKKFRLGVYSIKDDKPELFCRGAGGKSSSM